jgi:CubicO group peptidase (beta-lactamase class C family)
VISNLVQRLALGTLALALMPAAGSAQRPTFTVDEPYDWTESDPRLQDVDPAVILGALDAGMDLPYLYSLLVVRNGVLIGERYYGGTVPTDANTVMSVSKSFLSALIGLAQLQGHLDINLPMLDFFPDYAEGLDSRKQQITVQHLLTMTGGFPGDEYDVEWARWMQSPDWVGYCLRQSLEDDPGESWHYSTCSTHIASALLSRATGVSTRRYAMRNLFRPLGIEIGGWLVDPQGVHRGGWDMYLAPRDVARFGHLYLRKGRLGGRRILPRRWVRKTTRPSVKGQSSWGSLDHWGYGHWWWTGKRSGIPKFYFGLGYGGQFLINVPKLKVTIVTTADGNYASREANDHELAILGLIVDRLLEPLSEARPPD